MKDRILNLDRNQKKALERFKERVKQLYNINSVTIFGSTSRGEAEEGSDLDVLLVTTEQLSHRERHVVYNIVTEINWEFDTNISVTVVDKYNWEQGIYSIMLIKEEVERDGVVV
ncbi:MAG: nucleotidyltransferase domain-containing protein [Bacillota bacterium]